MKVNFGGFVPVSTVDWYGRAVCTVFLRGCPVRCTYCQNRQIQNGEDWREVDDIIQMVRSSRILVSGVVFSGGEPTMQKEPLLAMAQECRKMELKIGIQTNGVFPDTLDELIKKKLVDKISLDLKARWERYDNLLKKRFVKNIQKSLVICSSAVTNHTIQELEIVVTLFRGYEDEVQFIARDAGAIQLVLQQGIDGNLTPLSLTELKGIADQIGRKVKIRTREFGEVTYEGNRSRWFPSER